MNIILGDDRAQSLADRYTVLPLDTFYLSSLQQNIRSYCVVESMPISELSQFQQWYDLHGKLIDNYARQNWQFCEQAIEHLLGKWNRELDTFYQDLLLRVQSRKPHGVDPDWTPIIER